MKIWDLGLGVCGLSRGDLLLQIGLLGRLCLLVVALVPGLGVLVLLVASHICVWIDLLFFLRLIFFRFSLLGGSSST